MELKRNSWLAYGLLAGVWALVVGWQAGEHAKVRESAKADLIKSSNAIANTVGAFIRGLQFRGAVFAERLEPVLNELVNGSTNELVKSGDLVSIALLNAAGDRLASEGRAIDLAQSDLAQEGEHWGRRTVTKVYAIEGATVAQEGVTNPATIVLPPRSEFTNSMPEGFRGRGFPPGEPRPDRPGPGPGPEGPPPDLDHRTNGPGPGMTNTPERLDRPRETANRPRRPFWARGMDENDYQALIKKRELHGLVLALSTDTFQAVCFHDLWLRCIIAFFAGISAIGAGVAWRNLSKSSELQIRLVRASELNAHLKEMNLAAAGLAHETRNPLNIVRGLAQMISRRPDAPPEVQNKSREIIDETDKVTAQLNEFINYSRPRELRRSALALNPVASEVVRALNFDIEEKGIRVGIQGEPLVIEADEQLLRQVLFNLVLNAIQAVGRDGEIQIEARRRNATEASIEIRDNGPGVPAGQRTEIFKPYFTTQQKGTGLGLAIVQQIVLAHGWEVECLSNEPKGAIFRITHLKLTAKH